MPTKKRGGRRANAGRKTKAEELGLPKLLAECVTNAERKAIFKMLVRKATKEESESAAALVLAYLYGKPMQRVEQSGAVKLLVVPNDGDA